jgi:hypothetical protein
MGKPLYTNNAYSALAVAIIPTTTVLQLTAGTGQLFPSPTGGDYFYVTLISISNPETMEIVQCTSRTGDYLTVVRGAEGTQPNTFNISDNVQLRITAAGLNTFASPIIPATNVTYVPSGTLTATNVQTAIDQLEVQINTGISNAKQEYQTATANQTIFTISSFTYVIGSNTLFVYVNGSKQVKSLNYTESSTSTVTFSTGLNVGDIVEFVNI